MQLTRNKLLLAHKAVFIGGRLAGAQPPPNDVMPLGIILSKGENNIWHCLKRSPLHFVYSLGHSLAQYERKVFVRRELRFVHLGVSRNEQEWHKSGLFSSP